jgi:hypothetical protein
MTVEDFYKADEIIKWIKHLEEMIEGSNRELGLFNQQYNPENGNFERKAINELPEELVLSIKEKVLKYYNKELLLWNKELKKL